MSEERILVVFTMSLGNMVMRVCVRGSNGGGNEVGESLCHGDL
jgi:hypothetical protein